MEDVRIGDTVVDPKQAFPLPPIVVEEPTVMMEFSINMSPLAGKTKGTKVNASQLQNRLRREALSNIALRVQPGRTKDSLQVKGRGTLQLGILIESLRREGFELMVGAPEVLTCTDPETGEQL